MPLTRTEVFGLIDNEREYQDSLWKPHVGQANTEHCMTLLHSYLRKAEDAWTVSKGEFTTLRPLAKMAAIIVRALEVNSESGQLLTEGLR